MNNELPTPRPRGRPRSFDRDAALAVAVETFWRLGYEGASIADLTQAMGITPQSLYSAFGSKAELYREALVYYQRSFGEYLERALRTPDVQRAFAELLRGAAREFTQPGAPHGCMISTAILQCAVENDDVAQHVANLRRGTQALLRARFERGIADGQLRADTDADALARFVGTIVQGLSVQAVDGAGQKELMAVADLAIAQIGAHAAR